MIQGKKLEGEKAGTVKEPRNFPFTVVFTQNEFLKSLINTPEVADSTKNQDPLTHLLLLSFRKNRRMQSNVNNSKYTKGAGRDHE